nr:hypothetical protein [Tanacetum cinerariifolium]
VVSSGESFVSAVTGQMTFPVVPRELVYFPVVVSSGGVIDLTGDEDPADEDGDTEMDDSTGVSTSLGG